MPPIPTTLPALIQRLTTLSDSNKAVLQLIHRLAKLDFQPGSVPLGADADPRLELSAEIHETLKGIEEDLELIRQEVEDVLGTGVHSSGIGARRRDPERERDKARLAVLLARLGEDLKLSHSQFRKAQLSAKRSADRAKQQERALLFSSLQSGSSSPSSSGLLPRKTTQSTQSLTADDVIASASSDVTAALRRTHQLMQSELSRSRFAQETLEQSTKALAELGDRYTDLTSLLSNSRNLVTTLVKSTKSDTWYLETAFYILVTTIIWLIFRRWLYGPISWFVWIPIKLFYRFVILTFAGIFGIAGSAKSVGQGSTSLIVKPSATGGIPRRPILANEPAPYVKVGLGGGRGWGHDPSPPQSLSQQVGQMAEEKRNQGQGQGQEERLGQGNVYAKAQPQGEEKEQVVRGDGTVLGESDEPKNPKKRMWEEDVEREKYEKQQAEAAAVEHHHQYHHHKRDEL